MYNVCKKKKDTKYRKYSIRFILNLYTKIFDSISDF